jgi:Tfp pilus assembly protein PilF
VDEWLASAKLDDSEETSAASAQTLAGDDSPASGDDADEMARAAAIRAFENAARVRSEAGQGEPEAAIDMTPLASDVLSDPVQRRRFLIPLGIAGTVAVLLGIVWLLAAHSRRGAAAEIPPHVDHAAAAMTNAKAVPYRSKVPGVDDLYLSGLYFYEQRTPESLRTSLQNFNDAIGKDPDYAPAYVGLADTYSLMREYSGMPDTEAYPKAKAAAERAIALDPKLPQAHASMGFIDFFWSWDAAAAETEFQTALALDPSSALAHHWYGSMLAHQGRFAQALQQLDTAQQLEPTSSAIVSLRALALGFSGHRDEGVAMLEEITKKSPAATSTHNVLRALSLLEPRNMPLYLDESRKVGELRHDDEWLQLNKAADRAFHSGGETAMWQEVLDFGGRHHLTGSYNLYQMAEAEAVLGHRDDAFALLGGLVDSHSPIAMGLHNDPTLKSLHGDPRFIQLETRMGCPPLPGDH